MRRLVNLAAQYRMVNIVPAIDIRHITHINSD
jgi:hypothetical protein